MNCGPLFRPSVPANGSARDRRSSMPRGARPESGPLGGLRPESIASMAPLGREAWKHGKQARPEVGFGSESLRLNATYAPPLRQHSVAHRCC